MLAATISIRGGSPSKEALLSCCQTSTLMLQASICSLGTKRPQDGAKLLKHFG